MSPQAAHRGGHPAPAPGYLRTQERKLPVAAAAWFEPRKPRGVPAPVVACLDTVLPGHRLGQDPDLPHQSDHEDPQKPP